MYDELVKSLRELSEMTALCGDYICFECPYEEQCSNYKKGRMLAVYRQAADAIETMTLIIDGLNETIKMYANDTLSEPPKEEAT